MKSQENKPSDTWAADLDPTKMPEEDTRWFDLVSNSFTLMNEVLAGVRSASDMEFQAASWVVSAHQQRLLNKQIDQAAQQKLDNYLHGDGFGEMIRDMVNAALNEAGSDIKVPDLRPAGPTNVPVFGIQIPAVPLGE